MELSLLAKQNIRKILIPAFFMLVFVFGAIGAPVQAADLASTTGSYWKNYFSSVEEKAVKKNAQQYVLSQIQKKSDDWKHVFTSFNIKKGAINNDAVKDGGLGTDKIKGLDSALQEKLSASGGTLTGIFNWAENQTFPADKLTGEYPALDGSKIANITASQINAVPYSGATGSVDLNGKDLVNVGNVGIGTANPVQQLEITKNFKLPTTTPTAGVIYQGNFPFIHTYADPASDGSNIFIGLNAGNLTMSPGVGASSLASNNIGVGYGALHANTTGWRNTAVGISAMQNNTTGDHNIAFGQNALLSNQTGVYNTALGIDALHNGLAASYNVAVGQNALLALDSTGSPNGLYNVAVGFDAAKAATFAYNNVIVGASAMNGLTTGYFNTAVGHGALGGVTTRYSNTALGYHSGSSTTNVLGGVFLGFGAGYYETGNNTLYIDNAQRANAADGRAKALIYGIFDATVANQYLTINGQLQVTGTGNNYINGNVGIGTTTPATTLDVNGQVKIQKSSSQPFACDATHDATIAATSTYRTCICNGGTSAWVYTSDGTSACVWQ